MNSAPEPLAAEDAPHTLAEAVGAVIDAAAEAEQLTGTQERTTTATTSHLLVRALRVLSGLAVCLLGAVLMVLPGPGIPLILAGLSILAVDIPFAARLRTALLARADRAAKRLPRVLRIALTLFAVLGVLLASAISVVVFFVLD